MFNSNNNGYSLADVAAAVGNDNNNGFAGLGGGWWAILLVIVLFGWGGFGGFGNWNGNGNASGGNGLTAAIDTNYLSTGIRDILASQANNFMTLNNELLNGFCDNRTAFAQNTADLMAAISNGFNTQNLANLQNSNSIQRDIYAGTVGAMQNTQSLQSTLAQMASDNRADTAQIAYNQATNACTINTNAANNTRDIVDAINNGNQMLANMINQNKVDAMQDKINDLQGQLQRQTYLSDNAAQTNNIVSQLAPKAPIPSYTVPNPYCNCGYSGMYNNMVNA